MQPMITNGLVGAGAGVGAALVGFLGNSTKEAFDIKKCVPTMIVGVIAGALSGAVSPNPMTAISAALSGEVLRKALNNYGKPETPK